MGVFSWCTSDTKKSIPCCIPFGDLPETVYLLNPFGVPFQESNYEGYGEFGGQDVYDLVADWNRKYLSGHPSFQIPQHGSIWSEEVQSYLISPPKQVKDFPWYPLYSDLTKTPAEIEGAMRSSGYTHWQYRYIGIDLACYDDRNAILPYPIKLVEQPIPYEQAGISPNCPYQGCMYPENQEDLQRGVDQAFEKLSYYKNKHALDFVFDEEISLSDDLSSLEGYVCATEALVARLKSQEPPLKEDQSIENINFYPVYNLKEDSISLQGHYYIEDGHFIHGHGFELQLTEEESHQLKRAFEAYCRSSEGVSCRTLLDHSRHKHNLPSLPENSVSDLIDAAVEKTNQLRQTFQSKTSSIER